MRLLVTGCAGFIGSTVAYELLHAGHVVVGIDSLDGTQPTRLQQSRLDDLTPSPAFSFRQCDIADGDALTALVEEAPGEEINAVFNLAARAGVRDSVEAPHPFYAANVEGVLNLLELCRTHGIPKFIQASTSSVYDGEITGPIREDADTSRPLSPYAASKKAAEALLHSYHHLHGMSAIVLRYFTVYGPAGRPDMSIFRFIRGIAEGDTITVYGDGTQQRDFTYVGDVARGTVAALGLEGYETLNLGNDNPVSVNQLIRTIETAVGREARIEHRPMHPADPMVRWADISRARELLGWSPSVGIEEGVRQTFKWYTANRSWANALT